MREPDPDTRQRALAEAERLREAGDPAGLGHLALWQAERLAVLEPVFELAERYLLMGQSESDHRRLLRALEAARAQRHAEDEPGIPGL